MLQAGVLISIGTAAGVIGMLGYAYYKGEATCAAVYEVKILKAKLANQEIALAYYKSAKKVAEDLAGEAADAAMKESKKYADLRDKIGSDSLCVDLEWLSELARTRQ